jgi:hypothetical protein
MAWALRGRDKRWVIDVCRVPRADELMLGKPSGGLEPKPIAKRTTKPIRTIANPLYV